MSCHYKCFVPLKSAQIWTSDSYFIFSFICLLPLQVLCTSLAVPTPANPPCSMLCCPQIIASLLHEISSKELQSVSGRVRTKKNNKMRPTLAQCHDKIISIKTISIEMWTSIFHLHYVFIMCLGNNALEHPSVELLYKTRDNVLNTFVLLCSLHDIQTVICHWFIIPTMKKMRWKWQEKLFTALLSADLNKMNW